MKRILTLTLTVMCLAALLAGCTSQARSTPQIAPMSLSSSQQEIVDLTTDTGQEVLLFEYSLGGAFNEIEVWVEVYNYGEPLGTITSLAMFGSTQVYSLDDGTLAIIIHNYEHGEFRWTISTGGGRSVGPSWRAGSSYMGRAFGPIRDAVPIVDGQPVVLYVSRFTTGSTLSTHGDHQYYLDNPEVLAQYTYVHLIKARFSASGR